jgi:hypothetical protein
MTYETIMVVVVAASVAGLTIAVLLSNWPRKKP